MICIDDPFYTTARIGIYFVVYNVDCSDPIHILANPHPYYPFVATLRDNEPWVPHGDVSVYAARGDMAHRNRTPCL